MLFGKIACLARQASGWRMLIILRNICIGPLRVLTKLGPTVVTPAF